MVDKLTKFIKKQERKIAELVLKLIDDIQNGRLDGCDVKKLSGMNGYYRLRKGRIRIIFEARGEKFIVKRVDYRDDRTYDDI